MPIEDPCCGTLVVYQGKRGLVRGIFPRKCLVHFEDDQEIPIPNVYLEYYPVKPITADNFLQRDEEDIGPILHRTKIKDLIELYNELSGKNVRKVHDQIDILRRLYALRSEHRRRQEGLEDQEPKVIETLALILKDSASFSALQRDSKTRSAHVQFKVGLTVTTLYFDDEDDAVSFEDYVKLIDGVSDVVLVKRPTIVRNTTLNTLFGANALTKPTHSSTLSGNTVRPPAGSSDTRIIKLLPTARQVNYKGKRGGALAVIVDGMQVSDWCAIVQSTPGLENVGRDFLTFYEREGLVQIGKA